MRQTFRSLIAEICGTPLSPMPGRGEGYGIVVGGRIIHELGTTADGRRSLELSAERVLPGARGQEPLRRRWRPVRLAAAPRIAIRGGLRWLDHESRHRFGSAFRELAGEQQTSILDGVAWPAPAGSQMSNGVAFFNAFRDLVVSGFFSSEVGGAGTCGTSATPW